MTTPESRGDDPAVSAELRDLALLLEADSPEPDPAFAAAMDEWARRGFPRGERPSARPRTGASGRLRSAASAVRERLRSLPGAPRGLSRAHRPALAVAASALLALTVVVALEAGGDGEPPAGSGAAAGGSAQESTPAAPASGADESLAGAPGAGAVQPGPDDALSRAVPPEPPGGGGIAPGAERRRVERVFDIRLAAPEGDLDDVAGRIVRVTARHDGFVASSRLRTGEERPGGRFDLRVPRRTVRAAIRDLSALGTVVSSSERGEDVTAAHESAEDALASARAERRSLLRRLERADSDRAARALRARLRLVSAEIRRLTQQLEDLRERSDFARVTVNLEAERGGIGGGAVDDLGDAFDDATAIVVGSAGVALRALGVAVPLLLLGGAAWIGARAVRRRRRESALA